MKTLTMIAFVGTTFLSQPIEFISCIIDEEQQTIQIDTNTIDAHQFDLCSLKSMLAAG